MQRKTEKKGTYKTYRTVTTRGEFVTLVKNNPDLVKALARYEEIKNEIGNKFVRKMMTARCDEAYSTLKEVLSSLKKILSLFDEMNSASAYLKVVDLFLSLIGTIRIALCRKEQESIAYEQAVIRLVERLSEEKIEELFEMQKVEQGYSLSGRLGNLEIIYSLRAWVYTQVQSGDMVETKLNNKARRANKPFNIKKSFDDFFSNFLKILIPDESRLDIKEGKIYEKLRPNQSFVETTLENLSTYPPELIPIGSYIMAAEFYKRSEAFHTKRNFPAKKAFMDGAKELARHTLDKLHLFTQRYHFDGIVKNINARMDQIINYGGPKEQKKNQIVDHGESKSEETNQSIDCAASKAEDLSFYFFSIPFELKLKMMIAEAKAEKKQDRPIIYSIKPPTLSCLQDE